MIELQLQVPGKYIFLDHAIERMERGLDGLADRGWPCRARYLQWHTDAR